MPQLSPSEARDELLYEDGNVFCQHLQSLQGMLGCSTALHDTITTLAYMDASTFPHELGRKAVNWLLDKSSSLKLLMFATICEGSGPDNLQSKSW